MNPALPPELALLEAQLVQLFSQVDAGLLTPTQAQPALDTLVTFDAAGNRWTVSPQTRPPDTTFLVTMPGATPMRADPTSFVRPGPAPANPGTAADPRSDLLTPPQVGAPVPDLGAVPYASGPDAGPRPHVDPGAGAPAAAAPARARRRMPSVGDLRPKGPLSSRGRLVVAVVVGLVAVVAYMLLTGRDEPAEQGTGPATAQCPALGAEVQGVPAELVPLASCLAAAGNPNMLSPTLAQPAGQGSGYTFDGNVEVQRAWVAYAAAVLYSTAGGPAATGPAPDVDLSAVPEAIRPGVAQAVALGIAEPNVATPGAVSRGEAAVMLDRVYSLLGKASTKATTAAPDVPKDNTAQGDAQARLAAVGVADTAPGAPFAFAQPLTSQAYTTMFGRALRALSAPGAATPTTAAPGGAPAPANGPSDEVVKDVMEKLQSGRRADAVKVLVDPGDEVGAALQTAYFAGFRAGGLALSSGPVTVTGDGGTSELRVTSDDEVYARGTATWVRQGSGWKLSTWPGIARVN